MTDEAISVLNGRLLEISTIEPYSPSARAKDSAAPESSAGQDRRQDDPPERRQRAGAERGGRLLDVAVEVGQHRLHGAHRERQRDEQQRDEDAAPRADEVDADRAVAAVERQQHQAGHDRRQRERDVDDVSSTCLPGNWSRTSTQATSVPMTALTTATASASSTVSRRAAQRLGVGDRRGEVVPARPEGLAEHGRQRQQHDQAEPEDRDPRPSARAAAPQSLLVGDARRIATGGASASLPLSICGDDAVVGSKNLAFTAVQPPRSVIVVSFAGSGTGCSDRWRP